MKDNGEKNNKKYKWKLENIIDSSLTKEEIKEIVNKKLANIIIELELNPISTSCKMGCEND